MSGLEYTVLDGADTALNKTTTLVTGERDALLVDACFTRADGHRAVAAVLDSGKNLTAVLVTAADPDFYFGAEVIADAFPEAKFYAPTDVAAAISASFEAKLGAWAHLGNNLPTRLVPFEPLPDTIELEGATLQARRASELLGARSWYLFEPERRTLLGGVLLFGDLHVWTADTASIESRTEWLKVLNDLEALHPVVVIAGHRLAGSAADVSVIHHTKDYLGSFNKVVAEASDAEAAETTLLSAYPNSGLLIAVNIGTKVAKGEMSWG